MKWKTRITDMLGVEYPIIEGAFHAVGTSKLAVAVSEAGGFGLITAGALRTPEKLRDDIRKVKQMTDKPFGINISIGYCPRPLEMLEVALNEGIKHVETSVYNAQDIGKRVKEAGGAWIHKVAHIHHALAAERQGADAVCIVGLEGVGEKGDAQVTTLTSITVAKRLMKVPIIAAGGIGDARTFLAALAMGADAVLLGTAFYICRECPASEKFKQRMIAKNPLEKEMRDRILMEGADLKRDELLRQGAERIGSPSIPKAQASMAIAYYDSIPTAKEVIDGMIQGAEDILKNEFPFAHSGDKE